jgi:SAM-dependent methyltransferase
MKARSGDHVEFYARVMRARVARGAQVAVGSKTNDAWLQVGETQFEYLVSHGLGRDMRMLDIGCGNLRGGRLFIDHLDAGNYWGLDISPEILLAATDTVAEYELQSKVPRLSLVRDLKLEFLPEAAFDVVHAHSVFSHSPIEVIRECLASVGRVLAPHGFFDFTYNATEGREHHVLHEDFYYRTQTLIDLAARHGLEARPLRDWREIHAQSKLRLTKVAGPRSLNG